MFARTEESPISKRSRGNHAPAIKKKVALAAVRNEGTRPALAKRLNTLPLHRGPGAGAGAPRSASDL